MSKKGKTLTYLMEVMTMVKKRLKFNEFNVPIPKGHKRIIDKDENTEYLFINAPNDIYTVYFHSGMPLYEENILNSFNSSSNFSIISAFNFEYFFFEPFRFSMYAVFAFSTSSFLYGFLPFLEFIF